TSCKLPALDRSRHPKSIRTKAALPRTPDCPRQSASQRQFRAPLPPFAALHKLCASTASGRKHVSSFSSLQSKPPHASCPSCKPPRHLHPFAFPAARENPRTPRNLCNFPNASASRKVHPQSSDKVFVPPLRSSPAANASTESARRGS